MFMWRVFTGLIQFVKTKMSPKGGECMLTNVLGIVIPTGPIGTGDENTVWPFCSSPVFAIFNLMF